jgi:hypothetical protein
MLLIAVTGFAFSMSELWGSTSDSRLFAQHVRGVSRFLENILRQAEPPPEVGEGFGDAESEEQQQRQEEQQAGLNPGSISRDADTPRVAWRAPPGRQYGAEEFLTFELPESPGIFAWPGDPLPFVVCAIRVDPGEGLFLLWKSRLEEDFEDEAPRELLLSRYVTGITYHYYDTTEARPRWESSELPRSSGGERDLPARIELTFEYKGEKLVRSLVLPTSDSSVPVY